VVPPELSFGFAGMTSSGKPKPKHRHRAKPAKDKELVPTQPDNVEESEEESDWGGYDISIGTGDGDSTITEDLPIQVVPVLCPWQVLLYVCVSVSVS
jgi:hypothetical protein